MPTPSLNPEARLPVLSAAGDGISRLRQLLVFAWLGCAFSCVSKEPKVAPDSRPATTPEPVLPTSPPPSSVWPATGAASIIPSGPKPVDAANAASTTSDPTPPSGLRCLVKYYVGKEQFEAGAWWLVLPDGQRLEYDDGKQKGQEERLRAPDLEDTFHDVYPVGAIAPVADAGHDPGRYRVDALFRATYGQTANEVKAQLLPVTFGHHTLRVHQRAVSAFKAVAASLSNGLAKDPRIAPILENLAGTFNWRNIAGTEQLSAHSFGVSLDVNTRYSDYWRWQSPNPEWKNQIPGDLVQVFEKHGFIWGGRWYHFDTMHFEYRPELLDPACYQQQ